MSSQKSTAITSAPSLARASAWLRPWPRAAPVMRATFPATRPDMTGLLAGSGGLGNDERVGELAARDGNERPVLVLRESHGGVDYPRRLAAEGSSRLAERQRRQHPAGRVIVQLAEGVQDRGAGDGWQRAGDLGEHRYG